MKKLKNYSLTLISCLSLFAATATFAEQPPPHFLSLRDAIMLALRFNPNIANAELDRITQKYELRVAEHDFEWQPGLTGAANYSRQHTPFGTTTNETYDITPSASKKNSIGTDLTISMPNTYSGGSGNSNDYNPELALEVKQPLLRGFGRRVNLAPLENAYDTELQNKLDLQDTVIRQILSVIQDYRVLVTDNNNLQTAKESLQSTIKREHDTAAQIRAGRLPRTEIVEQQAQIASLRLGVTQAIDTQSQDKHKLLADIGLDPDYPINVPNDVSMPLAKLPKLDETIDYALKHNLPYVKFLIEFRKIKRDLYIAKDNLRWQLDLDAAVTTGTTADIDPGISKLTTGRINGQTVGLKLTVPIDNLSLKSQLAAATVSYQKTQINIADQQRQLRTAIKDSLINIASLIEQVKISEEQVKLNQRSYELEVKKQQAGKAASLDVSVAQDKWIQSKRTLISAKISYLDAVTSLDATLARTLEIWGIKIRY